MFFSNTHWPQLTAPFYSILFETSICQFNSSKFSPIMPDEVREHLTRIQRPFLRPESLQILQIPSSMLVLLLFSSSHSFSIGFRSEDWNGHSRSLVLFSVTHFCVVFEVCVWIIVRLEDPNMAHYKMGQDGPCPTFSVEWKFLIISLMVEMGIFSALALFLKPLH